MNVLTTWLYIFLFALLLVYVFRTLLFRAILPFVPFVSKRMYVITLDEEGNEIEKREYQMPVPDKIESNAINHVVKYVARLVQSSSPRCYFMISSPDENMAVTIMRENGSLVVVESVMQTPSAYVGMKSYWWMNPSRFPPGTPEPEKEKALLRLFAELGITPTVDEVHEYNGYADAMRDLHYPIGNDIGQATQIIQRLLREVHNVRDSDALHFTFEE